MSLLAATQVKGAVRRRVETLGLYAVAVAIACLALICALVALHAWLATFLSPAAAAGIMSVVLLVLAGVVELYAHMRARAQRRAAALSAAALAVAPAAAKLVGGRKTMALTAAAGVAALAFLVGRQLTRGE